MTHTLTRHPGVLQDLRLPSDAFNMFLHLCSLLSMGPWPFPSCPSRWPRGRAKEGAPRWCSSWSKAPGRAVGSGDPCKWALAWSLGPRGLAKAISRVGQGEGCEGKRDRFSPLLCHRRLALSCETGPDGGRGSHVHSSAHQALPPFASNKGGAGHLSPPSSGRASAVFLMGTQTTPGKKTRAFFALPIML